MTQLKRKIANYNYYCEHITENHKEAKNLQKMHKECGSLARIIKLQKKCRTVYGVFVK
jgi:ligand-binding sensor protein